MKRRNEKQSKRIRNLVVFCSLCAILLSVSTYAWFIGFKTVSVNQFEVKIATTEGLFLSMNGTDWTYELDAKNATAYTGNANVWADGENEGLIPMSTVGDMDATSSRMKLYEKGSLTATPGGYRLLASQVNNYTNKVVDSNEYIEGKGYVAFDLFVKNLSGEEYYVENNELNEEAIYLTTNSAVKVATSGVQNTGIENSVRVAFVQLGRVRSDTEDAATITGITCADVEGTVTGICRDAQIWEPNDKSHVQNALNWYTTSCSKRSQTGADVRDANSYTEDACTTIALDAAVKTYAISRVIDVADNVNVYDGAALNTYTANSTDYATYAAAEDKSSYKLVDFPYFTDTMKMVAGADRPQFMTLAPNSITKLRVYIYLEGQDVDNYDFASLGNLITVNFGFTKERYVEADFPTHDGPATNT